MPNHIQNRIASVRSNRGLSVAELAKRIGVTRQTVYAIESDAYMPNTEVALRLARELEVAVEDLFQLAEPAGDPAADFTLAEHLSTAKPQKGDAVRTCKVGAKWVSVPASAAPYYLPEADGVVAAVERRADRSRIHFFSKERAGSKRLVVAGCDPAASLLAHMVERIADIEIVHAPASSQLALDWLQAGQVHLAGSHLEDSRTGEFNVPFVRRQFKNEEMAVVTFAEWEAGFVVAKGNPKSIHQVDDLAGKGIRFVNRANGSGSRALLDKLRQQTNLSTSDIQGYDRIVAGHLAAAYAVFAGEADCCLATQSAARTYNLDFIPLHRERYDFILRRETFELPQVQALLDVLQRADLRRKLESLAGYCTRKTGAVVD